MAHKMTQKQSRMANLAVYQNPGLATATSTRVDSAAKHILACKVDSDLMLHLVGDSVPSEHRRRELHVQKQNHELEIETLVSKHNKCIIALRSCANDLVHGQLDPEAVALDSVY